MPTDGEEQRLQGDNVRKKKIFCCCCTVSVESAALIIAIITAVVSFINIFLFIDADYSVLAIITNLAWCFTAFFAIYGTWKHCPQAVFPFLVMQCLAVTFIAITLIGSFVRSFYKTFSYNRELIMFFYVIFLPLELWLTYTVRRSYNHMKASSTEILEL
ncbi:hypothetical protein L596_020854 [Steinernema carpocapsae]|uniref:MARVEL domain-containing protein n=1 Tax=Steinernema carpocapsae TaxID=34508 RepID=A0A4U5MUR3_STECR|nr:hypothetical protein L596_020854 [Steinernema carpocapsae]